MNLAFGSFFNQINFMQTVSITRALAFIHQWPLGTFNLVTIRKDFKQSEVNIWKVSTFSTAHFFSRKFSLFSRFDYSERKVGNVTKSFRFTLLKKVPLRNLIWAKVGERGERSSFGGFQYVCLQKQGFRPSQAVSNTSDIMIFTKFRSLWAFQR